MRPLVVAPLMLVASVTACGGHGASVDAGEAVAACAPAGCAARWVHAAGDGSSQFGYGVANDSQGNVYVIGEYGGTVDLGAGKLENPAGSTTSGFVAKYDRAGRALFSLRIGGSSDATAHVVAISPDDHVLVGGWFKGTLEGFGATLTSAGDTDAYVIELDANGQPLMALRFGDAGSQSVSALAVDREQLVVGGDFDGSIDLGGGPLTSAGFSDVFVARLDRTGKHVWSRRWGGEQTDVRPRVALAADGSVFATAIYRNAIDLGAGPIVDRWDGAFLAHLDGKGALLWGKGFPGDGWQYPDVLAVAPNGDVFMSGSFTSNLDCGSGLLASQSGEDAFVASWAADGTPKKSARYGGFGADRAAGLAFDARGTPFISGDFTQNLGPLVSAGGTDIYLARLDANLAIDWAERWGDAEEQRAMRVAVDAFGDVTMIGSYFGTLDFGPKGRVTSNGGFELSGGDVYLVSFGPK